MKRPPNVLFIVVDSLRAKSLRPACELRPHTPFLDELQRDAIAFTRAYATECWTLPSHVSMFTGLLPSEHGAHFQSMAYQQSAPTLAEVLRARGYDTAVLTRNSLLDGTVPGVTRGFQSNRRILAEVPHGSSPFLLVLALAKPRLRRFIEANGFFTALQRGHRDFLTTLVRMGMPADREVLSSALELIDAYSRRQQPYFMFLNLYDVHAPYSPSLTSPLRPFGSPSAVKENLLLPWVLPRISSHGYLQHGFRVSSYSRQMLLRRYHRAIELMDEKLAAFYESAQAEGLFENTLLIVTSDHGEAFGEHGLYFHDGSVYNTHLHVPLWVRLPGGGSGVVDDVVSTRDLFGLITSIALGSATKGTMLDRSRRETFPVALAEHFHYPHARRVLPRFRHNIAAATVGNRKIVLRPEGCEHYDLRSDPDEACPGSGGIDDFAVTCRRDGVSAAAIALAVEHLHRWDRQAVAA